MSDSADKLSPHYRSDDADGLSEDLRRYLDKHYFQTLDNLQTPHSKILVVFSGGSALGKSTLSQRISDDLDGLVIENDAIKRCILQWAPDIDHDSLQRATWQYSMSLYGRLETLTSNGLIVRDGIIDWYYDRILPIFLAQGYKLFIIAFDISRAKRTELITRRGDTPTTRAARLLELLDDHDIHTARFRQAYSPNITLHDDDLFDHDRVISTLRGFLNKD